MGVIEFVFGKSRHPLTARKRQLLASWDLPRKSKNLRPCAVHFGVLHKVFFLLILSLQITQPPLLSSPSGQEQTQQETSYISGQTPIFPHHIILSTQKNGREIPLFFSSRFWREKDRVKKRPCDFLEIFQSNKYWRWAAGAEKIPRNGWKHPQASTEPFRVDTCYGTSWPSFGCRRKWWSNSRKCLEIQGFLL